MSPDPTSALLFAPDPDWTDGKSWLRADRNDNWPDARRGPPRLSPETIDRISDARIQKAIRKTKVYLRKVLPPNLKDMPETDLHKTVIRSRKSAAELGIKSAGGHQRWAYLMVITEGKVGESPDVIAFIRSQQSTPDQQVKSAMKQTLERLKETVSEVAA